MLHQESTERLITLYSSYLRKIGFIIQKVKYANGFLGDHVKDGLIVIVLDGGPFQLFFDILSLFQFEDVFVEIVL